ncbi:Acyl-CoA dehydrogenase/oxidase C-terminal [Trinorchestia longiramus]|nr:Acyl-CoA dehydrogenase/oxidase C-terminal [Trinorchestia longiramus]
MTFYVGRPFRSTFLPGYSKLLFTSRVSASLKYNAASKAFFSCTSSVAQKTRNEQQQTEANGGHFYNAQQLQIQDTVKKIIEADINPHVDEWENKGAFPAHEVFSKLGSAGLLGISKPEEYGGLGLNYKYNMAMLEALGNVNCGSIPMAVSVQTDMATPALAWFGSDKLKREFLAPSIGGELVACVGVSEAHAGSDVAGIKTTAKRVKGDLIINGSKMWITNGAQADWMCLLANTSTDKGPHRSKSLICLPLKTPGVTVARKIDKLGMRCSDTAELFFDDVRVPADYIIGEEGEGFTYQMMQFQDERLCGAICVLAPMQKVLDQTSEYTHKRMAFGKPLIANQVIHFRLAELQTELECLKALLYRAGDLYVEGENVMQLASMAKLKSGRLAREITDSCLQYWGGMGFTNEVLVSRLYRDMRLVSIGGGADEVMLGIIAKTMGNLPSRGK